MPKTTYDLRRIRKIYPNKRRSPLYINTNSDVETFAIQWEYGNSNPIHTNKSRDVTLTTSYNTPPAVIVTAHQDNVNAYVSSITEISSGEYTITVTISHLPTGAPGPTEIWVHGHAVPST